MLNSLNQALQEMGGLVAQSVHRSVLSLVEKNEDYASQVLRDEARIDQLEIQIDDFVAGIIARENPVARDMRFVLVAIKINGDLERMGDMAVGIVERSRASLRQPALPMESSFVEMGNVVESMVLQSLEAFVKHDSQLARGVLKFDDTVDSQRNSIEREMIELMKKDPATVERAVDYILISRRLERIADHATNIAEDVIFMVQGVDVRHQSENAIE
jgi:phosphate transport system protein